MNWTHQPGGASCGWEIAKGHSPMSRVEGNRAWGWMGSSFGIRKSTSAASQGIIRPLSLSLLFCKMGLTIRDHQYIGSSMAHVSPLLSASSSIPHSPESWWTCLFLFHRWRSCDTEMLINQGQEPGKEPSSTWTQTIQPWSPCSYLIWGPWWGVNERTFRSVWCAVGQRAMS